MVLIRLNPLITNKIDAILSIVHSPVLSPTNAVLETQFQSPQLPLISSTISIPSTQSY